MKTFTQFNEDLDRLQQRRNALRKRQLAQVEANKQRVAAYQQSRQEKLQRQREKEEIKQELKRELQTEQSPVMEPNLYSQQVARRQAAQKTSQIRHVHGELGAEARAQVAAKNRRLKAIMSR